MTISRVVLKVSILACLVIGIIAVGSGFVVAQDDRSRYEGDCVFCWVDGSEADMPVWSVATGGYVHQSSDTREQFVIDQTFAVRRGEIRTFSNKIVWVRPTRRSDVEVYGTLIFENCLLLWDQSEHQHVCASKTVARFAQRTVTRFPAIRTG